MIIISLFNFLKFGYEEQEILDAMTMVNDKDDINMIIEYSDNEQLIDDAYEALMDHECE